MGNCGSGDKPKDTKLVKDGDEGTTATDGGKKGGGRFGNKNKNEPTNGTGPGTNTNNNTTVVVAAPQKKKVEFFLESVVPSFCEFVRSRKALSSTASSSSSSTTTLEQAPTDENKKSPAVASSTTQAAKNQKLLKIFVKTVGNFVHTTYRCSLDDARRYIKVLHEDLTTSTVLDESIDERLSDEGLLRCLESWYQNNTSNQPFVDRDIAVQITKELEMEDAICITKTNSANISFGNIVSWYYQSACLPTTVAVYEKMVRDAVSLIHALNGGNHNNNHNNNTENAETGSNASSTAPTNAPTTATAASTPSSSSIDTAIVQLLLTDGRQKESQTNSFGIVDQSTAKDFLHRHFGGGIVEENFCTFIQSHKSNSVFEAKSVSAVWQDMTQPIPNYLISSQSVRSDKQLSRALADNVRAFLIKFDFVKSTEDGGDEFIFVDDAPTSSPSVDENKKSSGNSTEDNNNSTRLTFQQFCEAIRDRGFKKNSFPIIICFPPWESLAVLTKEREVRLARILNETLGPMIAKGLMFRGATLRDPEFSPATLRHKVLLMSAQAKLNPFIGLFVSDMARTGLGVRVTDVKDLSPAASAGVAKDDWITRINNEAIEDKKHLRKCLAGFKIGEEFTVTRENLSQSRVVVGAAVDQTDPLHSTDFSSLLFFNFNVPTAAHSGSSAGLISLGASYAVSPSGSPYGHALQLSQTQHRHHIPPTALEGALDTGLNGSSNNNGQAGVGGNGNGSNKTNNGHHLVPNGKTLEAEISNSETAPPTPMEPATPPKISSSSASPLSHYAPWETAVIQEGNDLYRSARPLDHLVLVQPQPHHYHNHNNNNNNTTSTNQDNNNTGTTTETTKQPKQVKPLSTESLESDGGNSTNSRQDEEILMDVQEFGAQLVDSLGSRAASQWARGTFIVNGQCGYVLRDSLISDRTQQQQQQINNININSNSGNSNALVTLKYEWTFKLITLPIQFVDATVKRVQATVFGNAQTSVEAREITNLDEEGDENINNNNNTNANSLEQSQNNNNNNANGVVVAATTASSPSPITNNLNAVSSSPSKKEDNNTNSSIQTYSISSNNKNATNEGTNNNNNNTNNGVTFLGASMNGGNHHHHMWIAKIQATQQSRIAFTVDFEDGRRIESVLPAHLLRTGPRTVPFRIVDFGNKKFPTGPNIDVLCSVARKELK